MPLVYQPYAEAFFLWGDDPTFHALPELSALAERDRRPFTELVTPGGQETVHGVWLPLLAAVKVLATVPAAKLASLPASVASWTLASKLSLELIARERIVPTLKTLPRGDGVGPADIEARWAAALSASDDAARLASIARSMPPAAHAVALGVKQVWSAAALVRAFVDAVVDAFVRASHGAPSLPSAAAPWDQRWRSALAGPLRSFAVNGFAERSVVQDLVRWSEPALGEPDKLRACFRLDLPVDEDGEVVPDAPFVLRFLLQSPDDPSLLLTAREVWDTPGRTLEAFGRAFRDPQESLLAALGRAARIYPALRRSLSGRRPELLELDAAGAWAFLGADAAALADAGFGVILPADLTKAGRRRLRMRMNVGAPTKVSGVVQKKSVMSFDAVAQVDWVGVVGDEKVTLAEIEALAAQKAPLVRFRGAWIAVDLAELEELRRRIAAGPTLIPARTALQDALAGEVQDGSFTVAVSAVGSFADLLDSLRSGGSSPLPPPRGLRATLRPYQARGLDWLVTLAKLGLGGCLADDMGLGKTIQLLAFLLHRLEQTPDDERPALLIVPTSVLGNWEREVARFAPSLTVVRQYGTGRLKEANLFPRRPGTLVLTTYGHLRSDAEMLENVDWSVIALDEAQNVKNSLSKVTKAVRTLRGSHRFALTGTPMENRLAELWSILEFANPGFLGTTQSFGRKFAVPIERHGHEQAALRLRKRVAPFVLRRVKTDPAIAPDLPAKNEMKVLCTLTREQVTLYKAAVDDAFKTIEGSKDRDDDLRSVILRLLTWTKQICNHPAQFLHEPGPLPRRSGKLARLTAMLEEAIAAGDKALVFTQYKEMGQLIVTQLEATLEVEVIFLHGATKKEDRDELVRRFQEEPRGPRIFVITTKAGGVGLNLTAASHVFHYDRWWNPAVEDQATDRAHRIGQTRQVQVHKLVCDGTVEDKIDTLLETKRALASKVVMAGERWITDLGVTELRELFTLDPRVAARLTAAS
jgi:superfamily II DNA or RNA helicase